MTLLLALTCLCDFLSGERSFREAELNDDLVAHRAAHGHPGS